MTEAEFQAVAVRRLSPAARKWRESRKVQP